MKDKALFLLLCCCFALPVMSKNVVANDSSIIKRVHPLDEVVVTGTRMEADIRYLPLNVSVVNRQQIENRYEPSLLPLLNEQVPGLFVTSRGVMGYGLSTGASGTMRIRGVGGSPTTELLVLIDGHPQYMGLMGHSLADVYQSMLAEKVEVVRGPASVLYGSNAMAGVINIITRKQPLDGIQNNARLSYGSYNTLMSEYTNVVRSGKFSSIVAVSYNRTDGHRDHMDFNQYNGYAKAGYELNKFWTLTGDVNMNHFNASNPGTTASPIFDNDSHITRGMTSVTLDNYYERTSGAFTFFYNWGRHRINDGYGIGNTPLDYRFHSKDEMLGVNWYQTASIFTGNRLTLGFDYQHIDGSAWNLFQNGNKTSIADKRADEIAGYVDIRQTLMSVLTFDAGIRVDHHSHSGTEWIPQAGLSLVLPHNAELKAMVSKGFRYPTLRELYMFRPQNPDLLPERMVNYELSFTQKLLENRLSYGANLFYLDGNHVIETVMTNGKPLNVNSGIIKNWGIETTYAYRLNSMFNITGNYSFLHMKNPVTAAPKHKFYMEVNYTGHKWKVSSGLQWIGGLYTSVSPENKENFVLWNARVSYHLNKWFDLFANGENLLAQHYEINIGYPMPRATVMGGISIRF